MDPYSHNPLHDIESMLFCSFSPEPFQLLQAAPLPPPEIPRSAFARYVSPSASGQPLSSRIMCNDRNVHKKMIEFLIRRIPRPEPAETDTRNHGSRGFRHMMRERQRRVKMSQCYADLQSILPHLPKGDKNTIVQSAAAYIKDLEGRKEALQRYNKELRKAGSTESNNNDWRKIKIRAANQTSTVDSMISALRSLKATDVKARAIFSEFSCCELTVVMKIDSKFEKII